MYKKFLCIFSFLSICVVANLVYANIDSDLNSLFNKLGFEGFDKNITKPSAYQGQEAGYYTGGSVFARTAIRDIQIAQVELPSYRSGCGGIDLFAGGFSFIDKDQLIGMFKNVLNNAKSFAFTLAMETATPQITNVMKYLRNAASEINALNINSCETAAGLVGSVWPRTQQVQRRVCEAVGSTKGVFTDYASARHQCSTAGQLTNTLKNAQGAYKDMIFKEGNVAWKAIQRNGFLSSDTQLAELFMSLSGSIIVRQGVRPAGSDSDDDADSPFLPLPSLVSNKSLLKALLNGGTTKVYKCDVIDGKIDECLKPYSVDLTITQEKSLKYRVNLLLQGLAQKVITDTAITNTEIGLIQATGLPIQKMLNVQAAFYKNEAIIDVSNYSDIIAIDILFQYLNENLNVVRASTLNLQYPEKIMSDFIAGIDEARKAMRAEQKSAYEEITITTHLTQQTQMIENMLAGSFSSHMNQAIEWARGGH